MLPSGLPARAPAREPVRVESIQLVKIGPFPEGLAEDLAARLSRRVPAPCQVRASPLDVEVPWLPDRQEQVDADALLRRLEAEPVDDGAILVGVTSLDLAVPIFTFVFGRARHDGRAALVSLARLRPEFYGLPADAALTARRTVAEILHELGHVGGLRHCDDGSCLLRFAASVETVDLRGSSVCSACEAMLPAGLRRGGPG
jgi:archaemetzincin